MLPAHRVTKETTELLDSSSLDLSVWKCCSCGGEFGWSGLEIWAGHHVSNPRGPPVRHASNHFSLFVEVKTTKSHPQGRSSFPLSDRCGEKGDTSRLTRLGSAFVSSAPSSSLTSCVRSSCAALAAPTSCVVSKNRSASSHRAASKIVVALKTMQHMCRSPLALVFLHLGPHGPLFHV